MSGVLYTRAVYKDENSDNQIQFCTGGYQEERSFGREPLFREDLSVEADESPLLEAVTRDRLVNTAGWNILNGYCGDL
jgi:hypothetical protein